MANIEINNLGPAGSELFNDSESFLNELNDQDMGGVQGGLSAGTLAETLSGITAGTLGETVAGLTAGTLGGLSITAPV